MRALSKTGEPGGPAVSPRLRLATLAGRTASSLSRAVGRGAGGVIGGRTILKLQPGAVDELSAGRDVLLVSGTNGKTTTTAFLAEAIRTLGEVSTNQDGANTPPGFVTALANNHGHHVVLETDEGWLPWAVEHARPSTAVLLNLSRDQLSRHHEVSMIAAKWRQALPAIDTVVANADDPDIVWAALAAPRQVWVTAGQRWTQDSVVCPSCGRPIDREGEHWRCECGLARPEPDWRIEGDELVSGSLRLPLRLSLPGSFNQANAAMAVAAAVSRGADPEKAVAALEAIREVAGRFTRQDYRGRQVRLLLAKNPAGWLELIELVGQGDAPLVLAFNSEGVDGRDPSWLYDVSFEGLAGRPIAVVGRRATDMQVRLRMDGLDPTVVRGGLLDALTTLPPGPVDVLANYTAFQDSRRELARAQ